MSDFRGSIIFGGLLGLGLWIVGALIMREAPLIEELSFPVLRTLDTTGERHGSDVMFSITIAKLRACTVNHYGYQVEARQPGQQDAFARTPIIVVNAAGQASKDVKPGLSPFPPGVSLLGPFTASLPNTFAYQGPVRVWADVFYSCGMPWLVHAVFGPVDIPGE